MCDIMVGVQHKGRGWNTIGSFISDCTNAPPVLTSVNTAHMLFVLLMLQAIDPF